MYGHLDCKNPNPSPLLTLRLDNTYQISIWSNVEAGLGITAGCLSTLRPLIRFLRDSSSASRSRNRNPGSFPLSSNPGHGYHRSSRRSKHENKDNIRQLWAGNDSEEYQFTTTIMGNRPPNATRSSEENLNLSSHNAGWKVQRSVRVSVHD